MNKHLALGSVALLLALLLVMPAAALGPAGVGREARYGASLLAPGDTTLVSVSRTGRGTDGESDYAAISADGRYVVFHSYGTNLVSGDNNNVPDVFYRDRQATAPQCVSVNPAGTPGDGESLHPSVSRDGRYVAFASKATDLVAGDTNGYTDIFVRDMQAGQTTRVSVSSSGEQANGSSANPVISEDGRYVAFESEANNLVAGDTNLYKDIFVRDLVTHQTERVSVNFEGVQSNGRSLEPSISADGRYVAFTSDATNMVEDRDRNWSSDVFVHDRLRHHTDMVSVDSTGEQGNQTSREPSISSNGRFVAFRSASTTLVPDDTNGVDDVFLHDNATGVTVRVSVAPEGAEANKASYYPSVSGDGRLVAFESEATNLVAEDTNSANDIFLYDQATRRVTRVSVSSAGVQGDQGSAQPALSASGKVVAFRSSASNLVEHDLNGTRDIFAHENAFSFKALLPILIRP